MDTPASFAPSSSATRGGQEKALSFQGLNLRDQGTENRERRGDRWGNGKEPQAHGRERGAEAGEAIDQAAGQGAGENDDDLICGDDTRPCSGTSGKRRPHLIYTMPRTGKTEPRPQRPAAKHSPAPVVPCPGRDFPRNELMPGASRSRGTALAPREYARD
jgi:hypothetical protein